MSSIAFQCFNQQNCKREYKLVPRFVHLNSKTGRFFNDQPGMCLAIVTGTSPV
jgi:hypothetical protein